MNDRDDNEMRARLIALTKDLVLFPSTLSRPADRNRCLNFIRNHVESLAGVEVREFESGGFESFVAAPSGIGTPDVLLCAHLDVVEHPHEDAYRPRLENGRLIGAGAGDMKGPLAICLELFRWAHRRQTGISLGLAITSDEEIGGEHGVSYLFDEVGLRCGLAIIPDGGAPEQVTVEEKGILHLTLRSTGGGVSAHASRPWLAENPLDTIVAGLGSIRELFDAFAKDDSADHWHPTCSLTIVGTPNRTVNRIPHEAEATVDIRFPPPFTAKHLMEKIRELLEPGIELHRDISAEPTHLSPDPLFLQIAESLSGHHLSQIREAGGSDARFVCPYGIPVIMTRPEMGNLHAEDEWIDVESMVTTYRLFETYLDKKLGPIH